MPNPHAVMMAGSSKMPCGSRCRRADSLLVLSTCEMITPIKIPFDTAPMTGTTAKNGPSAIESKAARLFLKKIKIIRRGVVCTR